MIGIIANLKNSKLFWGFLFGFVIDFFPFALRGGIGGRIYRIHNNELGMNKIYENENRIFL